jgi:hypothetical protein
MRWRRFIPWDQYAEDSKCNSHTHEKLDIAHFTLLSFGGEAWRFAAARIITKFAECIAAPLLHCNNTHVYNGFKPT